MKRFLIVDSSKEVYICNHLKVDEITNIIKEKNIKKTKELLVQELFPVIDRYKPTINSSFRRVYLEN
jgi:hypothetical protein